MKNERASAVSLWIAVGLILLAQSYVHAKTTITVWDWKGPSTPQIQQWFNWIETTFEERNPDIEIDFQLGVQDYIDKFITAQAAGIPPDVFYSSVAWARDLFDEGYFRELNPYIAKSEILKIDDFLPVTLVYSTKDGRIYGIPFKLDAAALVYNRQHLREAGIDPSPTSLSSWDDFINAAKRLTRSNGGEITRSGFTPANSLEAFTAWLHSNGGFFYNDDYTGSAFQSERGWQTLALMADLTSGLNIYSPPTSNFSQGTASMRYWGTFAPPYIQAENPDLDFAITNFPVGPWGTSRGTTTWANMFTIPAGAAHPDEAWRYIEFVTSLESELKLLEFADEPGAPRLDFYRSALFLEKAAENDWMRFIPDVYQSGGPYPFLRFSDVNREVAPFISRAANGQISVTEAILRMSEATDRILRSVPADR